MEKEIAGCHLMNSYSEKQIRELGFNSVDIHYSCH